MPILYVHGVNVRSRDGFHAMKLFARRYIAPAISDDPEGVLIADAFWGEHAFDPKFGGASRPRTRLSGMGSAAQPSNNDLANLVLENRNVLSRLPTPQAQSSNNDSLASNGLGAGGSGPNALARADLKLDILSDNELADLLAIILSDSSTNLSEQATLAIHAEEMVADGKARELIRTTSDTRQQIESLLKEVSQRRSANESLAGQGFSQWITRIKDRLGEGFSRTDSAPAYALSYLLAELRPKLNDAVSQFLGDVFVYLHGRGDANQPGIVPNIVLEKLIEMQDNKLARNAEPLVVITHSMGGQLMYDIVSHFLPRTQSLNQIRVDFWCATASQVGFFEESNLFIESSPSHRLGKPVPYPEHNLGYWWNVWDHNDFLSFTARSIIDGLDDESYDSGMGLITAHGGYLSRPSFYRTLAAKISMARDKNFLVN